MKHGCTGYIQYVFVSIRKIVCYTFSIAFDGSSCILKKREGEHRTCTLSHNFIIIKITEYMLRFLLAKFLLIDKKNKFSLTND